MSDQFVVFLLLLCSLTSTIQNSYLPGVVLRAGTETCQLETKGTAYGLGLHIAFGVVAGGGRSLHSAPFVAPFEILFSVPFQLAHRVSFWQNS